jgi:hypothetical protein
MRIAIDRGDMKTAAAHAEQLHDVLLMDAESEAPTNRSSGLRAAKARPDQE